MEMHKAAMSVVRLKNTPMTALAVSRCLFAVVAAVMLSGVTVVVNPYDGVDWDRIQQHQANLHTHTSQSDGVLTPTQVIDEYHERGYTILALTDHNLCTWPWTGIASMERTGRALQADQAAQRGAASEPAPGSQEDDEEEEGGSRRRRVPPVPAYENRDPAVLGMLAVAGNELSRHHHMGAFFIQFETESRDLEQSLTEVGEAGGLAMLFHPGRYWEKNEAGEIPTETIEYYSGLFRKHEHLFGMEIINQGQRYRYDVELWDKLLAALMPQRPVWGYANDDMHAPGAIGRDSTMFLLTALCEQQLREAMLRGRSYSRSISTHDREVRDMAETPVITAIVHDAAAGTIAITARSGGAAVPDDQYRWVSNGETVHIGPTLAYKTTAALGNYVRAEIVGKGGTAFTNPFGLAHP